MIAFVPLALMQSAAPPAAMAEDIVVVARRLNALSVIVGKDPHGRFTCSLSATSGDASLDAQLCRTAAKCVAKGAPDVSACIDGRKPALLAALRASRARGAP